jgi:hypothetical protein
MGQGCVSVGQKALFEKSDAIRGTKQGQGLSAHF